MFWADDYYAIITIRPDTVIQNPYAILVSFVIYAISVSLVS